MSAKLHQSLAKGALRVTNRSSGEVSLYYPNEIGEMAHFVVSAGVKDFDLTTVAPIAAWRKSPNLAMSINQGRLDVILG